MSGEIETKGAEGAGGAARHERYIMDARTICAEVTEYVRSGADVGVDMADQYEFFQKRHADFARVFPIVLRYMVQLRQYHERAFVRHVREMYERPYRSEDEWCRRQADYVQYLHMELKPSSMKKENKRVWRDAYEMLKAETAAFKADQTEIEAHIEAARIRAEAERRQELKDALIRMRGGGA